jgi:hypothetical protein
LAKTGLLREMAKVCVISVVSPRSVGFFCLAKLLWRRASQPGILLRRQPQPDPSAPGIDPVLQRLLAFQVAPSFPASCQLPDFFWVGEVKLAGQGRLGIRFEELTEPRSTRQHERHINAVARAVIAGHAGQYRRIKGEDVHSRYAE